MKSSEMVDIFDMEEIEKMSPEQCKGLLMGFFIGLGLEDAIKDIVNDTFDKAEEKRRERPWNTYSRLKSSSKDPTKQDFRNIRLTFPTRKDAEEVLEDLKDKLEESREGYARVWDLYSLAELPTNSLMMKWGWDDLADCWIERDEEYYKLNMPPASLLMPDGFNKLRFMFKTLEDASKALREFKDFMREVSRDGFISVKDAMDISNQNIYMTPSDKIAASLYGWYDLDDVFVEYDHRFGGDERRFMIRMPPAESIDPLPRSKQSS